MFFVLSHDALMKVWQILFIGKSANSHNTRTPSKHVFFSVKCKANQIESNPMHDFNSYSTLFTVHLFIKKTCFFQWSYPSMFSYRFVRKGGRAGARIVSLRAGPRVGGRDGEATHPLLAASLRRPRRLHGRCHFRRDCGHHAHPSRWVLPHHCRILCTLRSLGCWYHQHLYGSLAENENLIKWIFSRNGICTPGRPAACRRPLHGLLPSPDVCSDGHLSSHLYR